jgi:biofilm PGA synthesis N-glycosyltransferase PgaC
LESSSANTTEELKRKIRIAAGGIQSVIWLKALLNPFKFPVLSFQYISHRVLRWTVTPFLMIACLFLNFSMVIKHEGTLYQVVFAMQCLFYISAYAGKTFEDRKLRVKLLFVPYYFCMMNYAVLAGLFRFVFAGQSVIWEKASRKQKAQ